MLMTDLAGMPAEFCARFETCTFQCTTYTKCTTVCQALNLLPSFKYLKTCNLSSISPSSLSMINHAIQDCFGIPVL